MKKIGILVLGLSCSLYAMEEQTNSFAALPFANAELPDEAPLPIREKNWTTSDLELLSKLLTSTINRKKFECANALLRIGAPLPVSYAEPKLMHAAQTGDIDSVEFFLNQNPSRPILNQAFLAALDAKQNNVAIICFEQGATLDVSLDAQKLAQYNAQIAEFIAPEAPARPAVAASQRAKLDNPVAGPSRQELAASITQQIVQKMDAWWKKVTEEVGLSSSSDSN